MALLDWISSDHDLRLAGEGVRLRPHRSGDFEEWAALRSRSRSFLQPWEPTWPLDDLTRGAWRRRLSAYTHDIERGLAYPFLVFRQSDNAMVGGITSFGAGNWDQTVWDKLIPIDMTGGSLGRGWLYQQFRVTIPTESQSHPIWRIVEDPEQNRRVLAAVNRSLASFQERVDRLHPIGQKPATLLAAIA